MEKERSELSTKSRQGAPIIAAGSVYFFVLFLLSFVVDGRLLELIWVVGSGVVFPLGLLIARLIGADILVKGNQLGTLAGVVGGIQALYIPVYIVAYKYAPEWLPFIVGTLTAAHFIPYIWLYQSRVYGFMIAAMAAVSIVFGSIHGISFMAVPLGIAAVYGVSAFLLNKAALQVTRR